MIVDDDPVARHALHQALAAAGHTIVEVATIAAARVVLQERTIDVVLLDLQLPDGNGLDLVTEIHDSDATVAVVVLTASDARADMRDALARGATSYLRKPADPLTLEAQVIVALARARLTASRATPAASSEALEASLAGVSALLEELPFNLARQLSHAWDLRHVETGAHVRRMAESTRCLALALGTSPAESSRLGRVAMLHDIGKIAIPDAILTKRGKLTDEEFAVMKRHAEIGGALLSGSNHPFLDLAAQVARSHHERWNGSGYPDGLVERECPWEARLIGVVDVYDALGQARCYKEAWPQQRLLEFFDAERGKLFDPEITAALLAIIPELELVKSEHPDPVPPGFASETRVKIGSSAGTKAGQG